MQHGLRHPCESVRPKCGPRVERGHLPPAKSGHQPVHLIHRSTHHVREDVVRIDHRINQKLQLMGHYLHDQVTQTYFPPLWGNSSYPTVGTAMLNPSWSSTIKLAQTLSPNLLNETAFLYSGNTIHRFPPPPARMTSSSA